MESSVRSRLFTAVLTVVMLTLSLVPIVWGPLARADHIPDTGQVPSNCVEFQAGTTGSKSPAAGVTITLNAWTDTPGDPHQVTFTISGLTGGQYVDISVKSGTNVQESGPYGNGTHSFENNLQQAISHIRLCVFVEETTTTTAEETTTTAPEETTTTPEETTTTAPGETTTTAPGETTTTVAEETTTTVAEETTTTVDDEVLPTVVTTTTQPDELDDDEAVASTLPFTGAATEGLGQLALALLALGALLLAVVRPTSKRGEAEDI